MVLNFACIHCTDCRGALKIGELTRLPSEAIHPSELYSGKFIVTGEGMPVIFVTSRERR